MSTPNLIDLSVVEVADHIFQIPVPLPNNPLKVLNSYLIRDGSRSLLIDTGFRLDACRGTLLAGLKKLGQDPSDMDIFVTHLHADHAGLAPELVGPEHTIYVSEPDYGPLADRDILDAHWRGNTTMFRQSALPESIVSVMDAANPAIAYAAIPSREKYTPVKTGQVITIAGYHLQCILTPGHTPGHMCLWDEKTGIMFTGDHVLFDITPNITTWPFVRDSLGDYLDSLHAIAQYPVTLALPGHRGSGCFRQRVQELISHHQLRLEEVLSLVTETPGCTTYDIAGKMVWSIRASNWEDFPAAQKIFAVGECQSHLEYLLNRELIRYETDGIVHRYYPLIH